MKLSSADLLTEQEETALMSMVGHRIMAIEQIAASSGHDGVLFTLDDNRQIFVGTSEWLVVYEAPLEPES